jgi:hypothetical protein
LVRRVEEKEDGQFSKIDPGVGNGLTEREVQGVAFEDLVSIDLIVTILGNPIQIVLEVIGDDELNVLASGRVRIVADLQVDAG